MNICIIGGGGYVGLITGVGFAQLGNRVVSVDVDEKRVAMLQKGQCPIYEEGLEQAIKDNLEANRITFTTDISTGVRDAEIIFVAVGSPSYEDGSANLSQVHQVIKELADNLNHYVVIVVKSTVPIGAVDLMRKVLHDKGASEETFDIVVNPEFLREGHGLQDFFCLDRIVIGTDSERARAVMRRLYAPFIRDNKGLGEETTNVPLIETSISNAQMIKYASNAFLATRISFINEVAGICERVGADITQVVKGMGYDPRIGRDYLSAGAGFGGPCLEKDLQALVYFSRQHQYEPEFLDAVLKKNYHQTIHVVSRLKELVGPDISDKRVAVFGLAFKAGTNDVRTSLSVRIIERLLQERSQVAAHDPVAIPEGRELLPRVLLSEDPYKVVQGADALLILTDWPQYRTLDYAKIASRMRTRNIVDPRNLLDPKTLDDLGFHYRGIGR